MSLVTWNPNNKGSSCTLGNDNLSTSFSGISSVLATEKKSIGKWYWEVLVNGANINASTIGIANTSSMLNNYVGANQNGRSYYPDGHKFPKAITNPEKYGTNYIKGSVIGISIDLDSNPKTLTFYNNGVSQGIAFNDFDDWLEVYASMGCGASGGGGGITANFGATPFKYDVPEGYLPYDAKNAGWFIPNKYLLKQDNKILTIESNNLIETMLQEPLAKVDFEELGFSNLDLLLDKDLSNATLLINPPAEATVPAVSIVAVPKPQMIVPTGDIILRMLDKIYNFTIYSNKNSSGDIKIIFSVDEGVNWLTYNLDIDNFEEIDITRIKEVKEKGIDPDTFNSINEKWNEVITNNKVRFAYYLEIESINDIAAVDKLEINMDMHGRWKKAKHGQDYHYKYDNDHLYVSFFTDGGYKINYQG